MCLVGSQRVGTPPLVPVCVASQLSGHVQRWGPDPGVPLLSAFSRGWLQEEGSFSLHFQDKVSFMRAACWTNQVNWEALNSSHWADPSFLLKADSADGEITSALNSGSPSLNFTPISGRRGSEQTCDTGVVQFSCAGSEVYYHYFFFYHHHSDYFFSTAKSSDLSSFPDASEALLIYTGRVGANCSNVFGKMERTDPAARLALDWSAPECC